MDVKLFVILLLAIFAQTKGQEKIRQNFHRSVGTIRFPSKNFPNEFMPAFKAEGREGSYAIWVFRMNQRQTLNIAIRNSKLRSNILKVDTSDGDGRWTTFHELTGQPGDFKLSFTQQFVRISLPQNTGSFFIDYEVILCKLPESLEKATCPNHLLRGSLCSFKCKQPDYLPVDPDLSTFSARCRSNGMWVQAKVPLSRRCLKKSDLVTSCLNGDSLCKYTTDQVLTAVGQGSSLPNVDLFPFPDNFTEADLVEEVVAPPTKKPNEFAARAFFLDLGGTTTPAPTTKATISQNKCDFFCKVHKDTGKYFPLCSAYTHKHVPLQTRIRLQCAQCRIGGGCTATLSVVA